MDNAATNQLINICYDNDTPTVLGRELHKALKVKTPYSKWFDRMIEYGFNENQDYMTVDKNVRRADGAMMPQIQHDHQLTLDMAKELCMLQRNDIGKRFRQYFIEVEKAWNTPEAVMARALQLANKQLAQMQAQNRKLIDVIALQRQQFLELEPKASYVDLVLQCPNVMAISAIAKDFGWSAKKMNAYLHEKGVQFHQGDIWLLYQKHAQQGYTRTKTTLYQDSCGVERAKVHTYWTQKGRLFIYELMKADGNLPLLEQMDLAEA